MVVPLIIHSPQPRARHALIKQGAKLVETANDVLEELTPIPIFAAIAFVPDTNEDEDTHSSPNPALAALGFDAVSFDALQARTGLDTARLQTQLLELELGGQVARLSGGRFQQIAVD